MELSDLLRSITNRIPGATFSTRLTFAKKIQEVTSLYNTNQKGAHREWQRRFKAAIRAKEPWAIEAATHGRI